MPNPERRQWPRRRLNLKVAHTHPKTQKLAIDFAKDVSRGGVFFWTKRQRAPGDEFRIELSGTPPHDIRGIVRGTCRVTRVTADGIGVEFVELDADSEKLLTSVLALGG